MNWRHLFDAARILAGGSGTQRRQGRPRQAMLKRAISTAYYAMFHALCSSNANLIAGQPMDPPTREAWTRAYRSLDHGPARSRLAGARTFQGSEVQQFVSAFTLLQQQRQNADYDPHSRYLREQVVTLIDLAESATEGLMATAAVARRPLAAMVLLRER